MSVKQRLPSLSLLYSTYEDDPEQTLDEAEVDTYFPLQTKSSLDPQQTASLFKTVRPRTKSNSISPKKTVTRDWFYAVEGRTLLTLLSNFKKAH